MVKQILTSTKKTVLGKAASLPLCKIEYLDRIFNLVIKIFIMLDSYLLIFKYLSDLKAQITLIFKALGDHENLSF